MKYKWYVGRVLVPRELQQLGADESNQGLIMAPPFRYQPKTSHENFDVRNAVTLVGGDLEGRSGCEHVIDRESLGSILALICSQKAGSKDFGFALLNEETNTSEHVLVAFFGEYRNSGYLHRRSTSSWLW
jgi:hypothetical protein